MVTLSVAWNDLDKILRLFPQDGTFDQIAPVKRLIAFCREVGIAASGL